MSLGKTIGVIKHPNGVMPAFYPKLLSDADVANIAGFLHEP
jgi:mono/diheme cytochrome c family protein